MTLFGAGLALVLFGGVATYVLERKPAIADRIFRWSVVLGCMIAMVPALIVLFGDPNAAIPPAQTLQAGAGGAFGIDLLSAWFLLLVLGACAAAAAYGVTYLGHERSHRRVGMAHLILAVLIAALAAVVTARTILAFLVSWEIMAVCAYFLVIFEHERPQAWDAGMVYLVVAHACTLALIGMFAAWSGGNAGWRFEDLARSSAQGLVALSLVSALALVGFGIKAGAVPFHFWLPGAHAAAPSHASALLSGVILKMGIYGLMRMLQLMGPLPAWWGWTVLFMGLVSAVLGVLWALAQHDLKRLLAYHSVENIGIILLGLGLGALGTTYHQPAVALVGYAGALLHTLNHAWFKSLLFLGAGSIVRATGTREIDLLGGLARSMPQTALAFLIGCVAIVGLPPLNGFVSEWLIYRGLLGAGVTGGELRGASVMVVGLALTGALALACFTKVYGVIFLGQPRDPARLPRERERRGLTLPQFVLSAGCIVIGVAPALVIPAAARTAGLLSFAGGSGMDALQIVTRGLSISVAAAGLIVLGALVWAARRMAPTGRAHATAVTWGGASAHASSRMQYTASSYAAPLLAVFGPVSGIREERPTGGFRTHASELVLDRVGRPLWKRIVAGATSLRMLQSGGVRWYLLYVILCLLGLLLYLRFEGLP
jgi:hydrogenase-4 component B